MIHRKETLNPRALSATVALLMGTTAMTALSLTTLPTQALAQDKKDSGSQVLEEIQVTGTRIRNSDFTSANPTTVIDSSYMQNLGIVNLGDAMLQIPSNVSSFTPQSTGNSNFFAGSTIADLRGINPFFGSRTLTLVDGRRHVPTSQGDSVDLNVIPTIILQRSDVVTGGASAAYGSGAISGVNNIILNKRLEGFKLDADYGVTGHADGDNYHGALAWGTSFDEGRGHVVLAGEYQRQDAIGCENARAWCKENIGFLANSGADPTQPSQVLESNLHYNGISTSGVFWNFGATPTTDGVTADGTSVMPFALGKNIAGGTSTSPGGAAIGGDGLNTKHYTNLIGQTERYTLHGHADYDVADNINLSVDGEYANVKTDNPTTQANTSIFASIASDNAYLNGNPDLAAAQAAHAIFPTGPAFFNKDWSAQLNPHSTFSTEVWSIVGDLSGQFGDSSWTWDAYVTHGHTKRLQNVWDNPHQAALNYALDAVFPYIDPTNPGLGVDTTADPVCRATREGSTDPLAQGCAPINPFGTKALSPASYDYAFGYLQEETLVNQTVAAANVSGNLFEGFGAGPVSGAVGGEYRWENIKNLNQSAGGSTFMTDYNIQYGESFKGKVAVWETFGEVHVPLLKDVPFAKDLEVDGAIRYSEYKNTGQGPIYTTANNGLTTWKISGVWDVTSWLRIRGSQSRDARAGNFRELYYGQNIPVAPGSLFYNFFCPGTPDGCTIYLRGNPAVKPEKSDTTTIGVVLTPPGALDGLQFAADYYEIKLKDGVTPAGGQQSALIAQCGPIPGDTCTNDLGTVVFYPGRDLNDPSTWLFHYLYEGSYNAASYRVKGIDFTLTYNHTFDNGDNINVRALGTKTIHQIAKTSLPAPAVDIKGQTGTGALFLPDFQSAPDWTANVSVTYSRGDFSGTIQGRYISEGVFNYSGAAPGDANYGQPGVTTYSTNTVPFYQIYNLNLSYTLHDVMKDGSMLQLFFNVNNLFDRDPNPIGSSNYFDQLGRAFRFGIRSTF